MTDQEKWETVHELLEPWRKVWEGDKEKYIAQFPEWMVYAAAELFAHDLCDAWSWNDYIKAATVIIDRHYAVHVRDKDLTREAENAALREEVERLRSLVTRALILAGGYSTEQRRFWNELIREAEAVIKKDG